MPFDTNLELLAAAATIATRTGSFVSVKGGLYGLEVAVLVPSFDRTTGDETMDVVIEASTDGSTNDAGDVAVFPQIIAAGIYRRPIVVPYDSTVGPKITHIRAVATLAGTTPNAGNAAVKLGKTGYVSKS